jgi:hypothetical protein
MPKDFLTTWLQPKPLSDVPTNIIVLEECAGQRAAAERALARTVRDHFVGIEVIKQMGGFTKAAKVVQNALPTGKITRSGDFGEVLATEYVQQCTPFTVPIRRLRYKDDRTVAMRGDDVLGFNFSTTPMGVLKTEAKSRVSLTSKVIGDAADGLQRHRGRPNPSTLSFISRRLRESNSHKLAKAIEQIQESDIPLDSVEHLIFTLSANDPTALLAAHADSPIKKIHRHLAACVIKDHAKFIASVFESAGRAGS